MLVRRIRREFKDHPYSIRENKDNTTRIEFMYKGKDIAADLPPEYPFKPPRKFYINGIKMTHLYFFDRSKAVMNNLNISGCCFMCASFLCSDNWAPSLTLLKVSEQMVGYRRAILEAEYRVYVRARGPLPLPESAIEYVLDFL